ncbi:MAG: redoxin family protein [Nitrospinota bacterium]|nr:redoxin family protein [Nitrospinota bacterium]
MKNLKNNQTILIMLIVYFFLFPLKAFTNTSINSSEVLRVGQPLPNAKFKSYGKMEVNVNQLKGKIKIISVVPQLNTPVCDKQTHIFSETNGGLDKEVDIITLSTNTIEEQQLFAKKAKINNLVFLSDNPSFQFGKKTGLLIDGLGVLRRTVMVVDQNNIIQYVDFVPGGGLPNIKKALQTARDLLNVSNPKG